MSVPIRGIEAIKAMREMFDAYLTECDRIADWQKYMAESKLNRGQDRFDVTEDETLDVFNRRRDKIAAQLENKGFKVSTETASDPLPSIAAARSAQSVTQEDQSHGAATNLMSSCVTPHGEPAYNERFKGLLYGGRH